MILPHVIHSLSVKNITLMLCSMPKYFLSESLMDHRPILFSRQMPLRLDSSFCVNDCRFCSGNLQLLHRNQNGQMAACAESRLSILFCTKGLFSVLPDSFYFRSIIHSLPLIQSQEIWNYSAIKDARGWPPCPRCSLLKWDWSQYFFLSNSAIDQLVLSDRLNQLNDILQTSYNQEKAEWSNDLINGIKEDW